MNRKIIRNIKRVGITLIILVTIVFLVNEILYKMSIPDTMSSQKREGKWNSSNYTLVSGKISVSIPENSEKRPVEFKSKAFIYYNLWSVYKPGQFKVVELKGKFDRHNVKGVNIPQKRNRNSSSSHLFKAKLSFGNGQFIEYKGRKNKTEISGQYYSFFPKDKGSFSLSKK